VSFLIIFTSDKIGTVKKTAIILGATGLTGGLLLKKLLDDERYDLIKVFSRRLTGFKHKKIKEILGDIIDLESFEKEFHADEVFCCIGTTASKTSDKEIYRSIDLGIPVKAAKLCKKNEVSTFLVLSSLGANPKSKVFYNRTKGEMEEEVLKQGVKNTYILRPSMILGNRSEKRLGENIGKFLMQSSQFLFIGKLKKYKAIEADKIAKTMIYLANIKPSGQIIESDKIEELAGN